MPDSPLPALPDAPPGTASGAGSGTPAGSASNVALPVGPPALPWRLSPTRRRRGRRPLAGALAAAVLLTAAGCGAGGGDGDGAHSGRQRSADAAGARTASAGGLTGVWQTDGYGTAVVVKGRKLRTYETTAISCAPGELRGEQRGGAGPGGRRTYRAPDFAAVTLAPESGGRARLRIADNAGSHLLHRVRALPHRCGSKPPTDPRAVFDVFWQTYAENYPFFATKGVDWKAMRKRYRPRIGPHTSKAELFAVLRKMIEPLHDAHTSLLADAKHRYAGMRPGSHPLTKAEMQRIERATAKAVGAPQRRWAHGAVSFAELPAKGPKGATGPGGEPLGYLRITGFQGYTGKDDYAADKAELDRALDAVFTARRTRALGGLVIDLRLNGGGADPLGLRIASRLTDRPYLGYAKRARSGPEDPGRAPEFTRPERIAVHPHHGPRYTGPVAVLTGRYTISAGETFTQALLGRSAQPVRIGENTQGVFSDTLDRTLPNGWQFSLPNEEFRTARGRTFDGSGIPPQHRTPVFTDGEFAHHRDSALREARRLLGRRR